MPPPRPDQQIFLNPDEQNMRKLFRIRIRQMLIFAVLETCMNIGEVIFRMEDEEFYLIWPNDHFLPSISWEMFTQAVDIGYAVILGYDMLSLIMWMAHWYKVVTLIRGVVMATEAYMVYYIILYDLVTLVTSRSFDYMAGMFVVIRLWTMLWLWPTMIRTEVIVFRRLGTLTANDALNFFGRLQNMQCTVSKMIRDSYKRLKKAKKLSGEALGSVLEWINRADPKVEFLTACKTGDRVTMRVLLSEHEKIINVNLVRTKNGDTGLHLACRAGYMMIAESLLDVQEKVVNVNIENLKGETPLMIAAEAGHVAIVRRLLKVKGLKLKDLLGDKSIKLAVENDHYEAARLILNAMTSKQIDVDANIASYLSRCSSLAKDAKSAKSSSECQKINLSLEVYKRNICEILSPSEPIKKEPSKQKSMNESIEDLKEFLDCSICFDEFEDLKIFACINDHWICSKCLPLNESCPFCRSSFYEHAAMRRYTSEKFLSILMDIKKSL